MTYKTLIFENFWGPEVVWSSLYQKILEQNLLIYIHLHCVRRWSWTITTLATLMKSLWCIFGNHMFIGFKKASPQSWGARFSAVLWIEIEDLNTIFFIVICQNSWDEYFIKMITQKTPHPIVNVLACVSTQTCPSRTFATADNISIQVNICGALNTT